MEKAKQGLIDLDHEMTAAYGLGDGGYWENSSKTYGQGMQHAFGNIGDGIQLEQERKKAGYDTGMQNAYGNVGDGIKAEQKRKAIEANQAYYKSFTEDAIGGKPEDKEKPITPTQSYIDDLLNAGGKGMPGDGGSEKGNWFENAAEDVGNWFSGAAEDVDDAVSGVVNDAVDWTVGAHNDVGNAVVGAHNAVVGAHNDAVDWVEGAHNDVGNAVVGAHNDAVDWTLGAVEDTVDWAEDMGERIREAALGSKEEDTKDVEAITEKRDEWWVDKSPEEVGHYEVIENTLNEAPPSELVRDQIMNEISTGLQGGTVQVYFDAAEYGTCDIYLEEFHETSLDEDGVKEVTDTETARRDRDFGLILGGNPKAAAEWLARKFGAGFGGETGEIVDAISDVVFFSPSGVATEQVLHHLDDINNKEKLDTAGNYLRTVVRFAPSLESGLKTALVYCTLVEVDGRYVYDPYNTLCDISITNP